MNFNVFHCSPTSKCLPCFKGRAVLVVRPLYFILCIRQSYVHPVLFAAQFLVTFFRPAVSMPSELTSGIPILVATPLVIRPSKKTWKWYATGHFIAMLLPCHRLAMAISLPCQNHVTAFIALSLPCHCHAKAMVPNGILIFLLPSITCCWKLKIPSMCCKSGATTKEPKVMAAPKMVDTFTIRLSEASWRFSETCMSYGSCICKMHWYYMIYHIENVV